jgi:phosphoribosylamine--glycine ligase
VIGSGAREHAIVWKLKQSPRIKQIFVSPGNAGTSQIATNLSLEATDITALLAFARQNNVNLTFVGPETPLAEGIVDEFRSHNMPIFGPNKAAARIEASKVFAKDLMHNYSIPCAASRSFSSFEEASIYVKQQQMPIVIKADGLAAGKGVIIAQSVDEALRTIKLMMKERTFGTAGENVVVEEFLSGREMSVFVFTDGKDISPPVTACDYKRIFDGNMGPNTGGMGSFSPPDFYTDELGERAIKEIMQPTIRALQKEGAPFSGVLYGGLMITGAGPRTIEFNCRLGDPETQVILPRLDTDLAEIVLAVIENRLDKQPIAWSTKACIGVVMASGGYPDKYQTGFPITGLEDVDKEIMVFHSGTRHDSARRILTAGGRVLTVVATAETLVRAREKVYNNISRIHFEGAHYRRDIALFDS